MFLGSSGLGLLRSRTDPVFLPEFLVSPTFYFPAVLSVKKYRQWNAATRYTLTDANLCAYWLWDVDLEELRGPFTVVYHSSLCFVVWATDFGGSIKEQMSLDHLQGKYHRWINKEKFSLVAGSGSLSPLTNLSLRRLVTTKHLSHLLASFFISQPFTRKAAECFLTPKESNGHTSS